MKSKDRIESTVNNGDLRDDSGRFSKGNPGKPKGAISLKTKVFNEILETWGDVKGKDKLKAFAKNNKNFPKYLNHIVALVKGNDDSIGSRFTNIIINDPSGGISKLRTEHPLPPRAEAAGVPGQQEEV